jgi:hypothetical protein
MAAVPVSLWVLPVVWLNRTYDFAVLPLGPLGQWLSAPAGRALLGGTGLVLLAAALAWGFLDWVAWNW